MKVKIEVISSVFPQVVIGEPIEEETKWIQNHIKNVVAYIITT